MSDPASLVEGLRAGSRRAIGRAITAVEDGGEAGRQVLRLVSPLAGRAIRVGLTGPPGVGKSTLIAALVADRRRAGQTVAVVSVDPSSPFSAGAVLGDRIRLVDHFTDPGVFIRSMASRGQLGGVAEGTIGAVAVLEAAGFDVVVVETVGAGQNEVDVRSLTDTVVLVLMPGSGDGVQAIKAGVMEIPDVVVVNKSDHPAAAILRAELESAMRLVPVAGWQVPIVMTRANVGEGIDQLWQAVTDHREALGVDGIRQRRRDGMVTQLRVRALARVARDMARHYPHGKLTDLAAQVVDGRRDLDGAVDDMLKWLEPGRGEGAGRG